MLSNKPYLIRAFYEWIVDNNCTPFLVINTLYPNCRVPQEYIEKNGEIVLNISPTAVRDLNISNVLVEFRASFSGVVHMISAPVKAVLAIYASENNQGMFFDFEEMDEHEEGDGDSGIDEKRGVSSASTSSGSKGRAHLKLVE